MALERKYCYIEKRPACCFSRMSCDHCIQVHEAQTIVKKRPGIKERLFFLKPQI